MTLLPFLPECHSYAKVAEHFMVELLKNGVEIEPPDTWRRVDLLISPPDSIYANRSKILPGATVVYTMFESTVLREEWVSVLNKTRAVLVPSNWCASVFSACGVKVPIHVVPLGHNPLLYYPEDQKSCFDPEAPFIFSTVFSKETGEYRKNNEVLLRAFKELALPDTELWIRSKKPENVEDIKGVRWFSDFMPEASYADWIRRSNCGVFVSRGEGFGLCPLEFSACAIPLITHRFSGYSEHVPYGCVSEVDGDLVDAVYDGRSNGVWFEVSLDSLKDRMSEMRENVSFWELSADLAVNSAQQLTWERAGNRLLAVLKKVGLL